MRSRSSKLEEVFWSKVNRGISYTCWPWISALPGCYGMFWNGTKVVSAHRFAWEISRRTKIPTGMMILHMCDNKPCCNPDHLYCGDASQNALDRAERKPRTRESQIAFYTKKAYYPIWTTS